MEVAVVLVLVLVEQWPRCRPPLPWLLGLFVLGVVARVEVEVGLSLAGCFLGDLELPNESGQAYFAFFLDVLLN